MGIGDVIGYVLFFALSLTMIFKPTFIRYFFWKRGELLNGWQPKEEHTYHRIILVVIRTIGVLCFLASINGLLIDTGFTKREILADVISKMQGGNLLVPIGFIVAILGILIGLLGIVAPAKLRSFVWSIEEKLFGSVPNENHFYQYVFTYWLRAVAILILSFFLLGGILKH